MKRRNMLTSLLLLIFTLSALGLDFSSATPRKVLLADFCAQNQTPTGGFTDTINGTAEEITEFTTYSNVYVLSIVDPEFEKISTDLSLTKNWFADKVDLFIEGNNRIPEMVYAFEGALLTNGSIEDLSADGAFGKIKNFQSSTDNGFAGGESIESNVIDTAFAVKFFNLTDTMSALPSTTDATKIANFLISCYDASTGAFKGSPTGFESLIDTYFALDALNILGQMDLVDETMKTAIASYVEANYISESDNLRHYGGYSLTTTNVQSSLMATFYSVSILDLIGSETHPETLSWVLDRQNPLDYGFSDYSDQSTLPSSAKLSYYAVSTIQILDSEAFSDSRSAVMNEEKWEIESNGWVIAAIWIGSIGLIVVVGILVYKYKNRI
ncbi:prenyltransferase/squalene oxidase repeat-containing protein [Candidatus Lokiarchaeum ossiferum]|uniref:prenyltransferase/squalene oxidase repeat-containing protein n=1 Tax=Candidatus Lokiarchaeum ossiferum TaxID=2951803 RepID=UPI00352F697B